MRIAVPIFFLASFTACCLATIQQVEADITSIISSLKVLQTSINVLPSTGGTLVQSFVRQLLSVMASMHLTEPAVKAVATNSVTVQNAFSKAMTDEQGTIGPISETDGRTILTSAEGIEPILIDILSGLTAKKGAFQAVPISNFVVLIKQDIIKLCSNVIAFEDAMASLCPADLVPEIVITKGEIDAACQATMSVYSDV